jgi:hypothetical protein
MKHVCYSCLLICFSFSVTAIAQEAPWWELHAGYQFTGQQTGQIQNVVSSLSAFSGLPAVPVGSNLNMNGWDFSAQENMNSWFGGIVDFSGGYGRKNVTLSQPGGTKLSANFSPALFTMGGGPQFSFRRSVRIQPFARVIFAAAYSNLNPNATTTNILNANHPSPSTTDTDFAMIFGGGFDYAFKNYAAFRLAADYIHTFIYTESQSNFRVTAGITFRIGSR